MQYVQMFAASGTRIRDRSLESVERLLVLNLVIAHRNRRGKIVAAQFREANGASPVRITAHMGTKYSYQEHLGDYRAWRLKDLPSIDHVRAVFRAVPLSCMA
jgi:hypothetical protein